jgi:hypothetical protein
MGQTVDSIINSTLFATTAYMVNASASFLTTLRSTVNTWTNQNTFSTGILLGAYASPLSTGQLGKQINGTLINNPFNITSGSGGATANSVVMPHGFWLIYAQCATAPGTATRRIFQCLGTSGIPAGTTLAYSKGTIDNIAFLSIPTIVTGGYSHCISAPFRNNTGADMTIYYSLFTESGSLSINLIGGAPYNQMSIFRIG